MKFVCTVRELADGRWTAQHSSRDVGNVETTAASRGEVLEKMTGELRYRLELCPCSGDSYQHVEIEIDERAHHPAS